MLNKLLLLLTALVLVFGHTVRSQDYTLVIKGGHVIATPALPSLRFGHALLAEAISRSSGGCFGGQNMS